MDLASTGLDFSGTRSDQRDNKIRFGQRVSTDEFEE